MKVKWTKNAAIDIEYWKKHDIKKVSRIKHIIESIQQTPFAGIGKPEPLKHALAGKWSRRISQEHRLVYEIKDKAIIILACRFHYNY
jgi:toxin YoeB